MQLEKTAAKISFHKTLNLTPPTCDNTSARWTPPLGWFPGRAVAWKPLPFKTFHLGNTLFSLQEVQPLPFFVILLSWQKIDSYSDTMTTQREKEWRPARR